MHSCTTSAASTSEQVGRLKRPGPSAAAEPSAAFRSDGIDASLAKILAAADAGDGELVVVMLLLLLLHLLPPPHKQV